MFYNKRSSLFYVSSLCAFGILTGMLNCSNDDGPSVTSTEEKVIKIVKLSLKKPTNGKYNVKVPNSSPMTIQANFSWSGVGQPKLEAIPDAGFKFVGWQAEGETLSTDNPWEFTLSKDVEMEGVFAPL